MIYVVINGKGGVGKDTFVDCCSQLLGKGRCCNISTVDFVKQVARKCGWNGEKDPATRKFLSSLKDILTEWRDIPFQDVIYQIGEYQSDVAWQGIDEKECVVFIHCREPHEIQRLVDELGARSLLIHRAAAESVEQCNHADNEVLNYQYDYTIYNNYSLSALHGQAEIFLREYLELDI